MHLIIPLILIILTYYLSVGFCILCNCGINEVVGGTTGFIGCFNDGGCLGMGDEGRGARGGGLIRVDRGGAVGTVLCRGTVASNGFNLGIDPCNNVI